MPTSNVTHHVKLTTSADATEQGLMLAKEEGQFLYSARRIPEMSLEPIKIEQSSWHGGFGDYLYQSVEPWRYGWSDGVDARFANGIQLAPKIQELDIFVRNGDGERAESSSYSWTAGTGATYTNVGTNAYRGSYHHRLVTDGSRSAGDTLLSQSLANPTALQSRSIGAKCWITAGGGRAVRLVISDTDGSNTSKTESSSVTASSYTEATVTHTVQGDATGVTISIEADDGDNSAARTHDVDDIVIMMGGGTETLGIAEYAGLLYLFNDNCIANWDETNDVWDALVTATPAFTSMVVHGGYIYASFTSGYYYSNDVSGARTTWSSVTPDDGVADFLVPGVDSGGVRRLYRVDKPNEIYVSTETYGAAIAAGNWNGTPYTVGEKDRNITGVHPVFDTILVGREDGLYFYYPPDDQFHPATDQFRLIANAENFDRGAEYIDGWFYVTTARYGLLRMRFAGGDVMFDPVAPRGSAPMYDAFGGRVRALIHDGQWLYAMQDAADADSAAAKMNLIAARNEVTPNGVQLVWHTLHSLNLVDVSQMAVEGDFLYIVGRSHTTGGYMGRIFRMPLPTEHQNSLKETTPNIHDTGTSVFVSNIFDLAEQGYAQDDKGWLKVEIIADGTVDANRTITIHEQRDDDIDDGGAWTAVGSAITSLTNGAATVSFTAGTTGKRLRLRFTLATNASTHSPVLRGFRIHAMPAPEKLWTWDLTCKIATGITLLNGAKAQQTADDIDANLETLAAQSFPLKFYDVDGTSYNVQIVNIDKVVLSQDAGERRASEHMEIGMRLQLREVKTS